MVFLSNISISRSVFATMLNAILIVFGIFAYTKIGIDLMPNVDFPFVTVQVVYPGADPKTVEQEILDPIEKAVNAIEGLDWMESTAYPNAGLVVLAFKLERDGDKAAQDVRDKIAVIQSTLPAEAKSPVIQKFDIGGQAVMNIAVSAASVPYAELSRLTKDVIKPAIEQSNGVGSVTLVGQREREIHVLLQRDRLQAFGLSPSQVMQSIQAQNLDIPGGKVENSKELLRIRTEGKAKSTVDIAKIMIPLRNGQKIRVEDVARVVDTLAEEQTYAEMNGKHSIAMLIFKQTGGNTVAMSKSVHERVSAIQKNLPPGVQLDILNDNSTYIKGSIESVQFDLILGALLAVVIVLFFLHDWRATIISAAAIPTAVIGTFAFITSLGFTLNVLTTLALTLSIGILVDDAIVVIENIYRRLELGEKPRDAARNGTAEIGLAAMAITLSIVAVFVPVAFMEGILGRFFYSFGMTVAIAVLLSLFVAFTLTPMMSSRLLRDHHGKVPAFFRPVVKVLDATDRLYRRVLELALHHRWKTIGMGILVLIFSVMLLSKVPMAFFPKEDTSQFIIKYQLAEGTSIAHMKEKTQELDRWVRSYAGIKSSLMVIGYGFDQKPNVANLNIALVDTAERNFSQEQIMQRLRDDFVNKFRSGTAIKDEIFEVTGKGGGGGGGKTLTFNITGYDFEEMAKFANSMTDFMKKEVPGTIDIATSEPPRANEIKVAIDSVRAGDVGVSTLQIGQMIRNLFEGVKIGDFEDKGVTYDVMMQLDGADASSPDALSGLNITSNSGSTVALSSVAQVSIGQAASKIERYKGMKEIKVEANFTGKDLGGAISKIESQLKTTLPKTMNYNMTGQADMMKQAMNSVVQTLVLAILLVFMVLCAQFESYLTPFVIMMSVPVSFSGAFAGLLLAGREMSIYAMIGLILLMGLVTKNAILLIDFTLQRMREGKSVHDALVEAGPIRLRPILMTTFAMIFGMIPIAIGHGVGGEARSPMAICVIGGLISSTLLTLVVVPCVFSVVESARVSLLRRRGGRRGSAEVES